LRIRFVRFRQTVWRVMHIVTIALKYSGEAARASTFPFSLFPFAFSLLPLPFAFCLLTATAA
jgi:hypothetical protein